MSKDKSRQAKKLLSIASRKCHMNPVTVSYRVVFKRALAAIKYDNKGDAVHELRLIQCIVDYQNKKQKHRVVFIDAIDALQVYFNVTFNNEETA